MLGYLQKSSLKIWSISFRKKKSYGQWKLQKVTSKLTLLGTTNWKTIENEDCSCLSVLAEKKQRFLSLFLCSCSFFSQCLQIICWIHSVFPLFSFFFWKSKQFKSFWPLRNKACSDANAQYPDLDVRNIIGKRGDERSLYIQWDIKTKIQALQFALHVGRTNVALR